MARHKEEYCTQQQIECIRLMVETDMTRQEIADKLGIARSTLYDWMSKEYFKKRLVEYSDRLLVDCRAESLRRIRQLMRQDEDKRTALSSAKFLAELNGLKATDEDARKTTEIVITLADNN